MKKVVAGLSLLLFIFLSSSLPANAYNPFGSTCSQSTGGSSAVCTGSKLQTGGDDPVLDKIADATQLVAFVGGIAAVIMLFISSIRFLTSGGNPDKASAARASILYEAIGLVVIAGGQAIIVFVLHRI